MGTNKNQAHLKQLWAEVESLKQKINHCERMLAHYFKINPEEYRLFKEYLEEVDYQEEEERRMRNWSE